MKRFEVGDFAITCNSRLPLVNGNLLVTILRVCGPRPDWNVRFGYLIERVDGQDFAVTRKPGSPMPSAGRPRVMADQHQLRPLHDRPLTGAVGRRAVTKV